MYRHLRAASFWYACAAELARDGDYENALTSIEKANHQAETCIRTIIRQLSLQPGAHRYCEDGSAQQAEGLREQGAARSGRARGSTSARMASRRHHRKNGGAQEPPERPTRTPPLAGPVAHLPNCQPQADQVPEQHIPDHAPQCFGDPQPGCWCTLEKPCFAEQARRGDPTAAGGAA